MEANVRRTITVTPDGRERFSAAYARSMIGTDAELHLTERTVRAQVADAVLLPDGNMDLLVELDAVPAVGKVEFLDGFNLRVCRARSAG
jgi:hypothetical protein